MALTKIDDRGLKTPIDLLDNEKIRVGTGNDFEIYHDGSDTYLKNNSAGGTLYLQTYGENSIKCNPNAATELYYNGSKRAETTADGIHVSGDLSLTGHYKADDNEKLIMGDGGDLEIFHDATDTWVKNINGKLRLCNTNANGSEVKIGAREDQDGIIIKPLGATEIYHNGAKKFETTTNGIKSGTISTSTSGSYGWIIDESSYGLVIEQTQSKPITIRTDGPNIDITEKTTGQYYIRCLKDAAVELYHNGSKKCETSANGINLDNSGGTTGFGKITFGNSGQQYIEAKDSGNFGSGAYVSIGSGTDVGIKAKHDAATELYYDNSKKFETSSSGATVNGQLTVDGNLISYTAANNSLGLSGHRWNDLFIANDIDIIDDGKILLGTNDDFQLYHASSNNYIDSDTGTLYIRHSGEYGASFAKNGAVSLYYDNSKKLETTSDGVKFTGVEYITEGVIYLEKSGAHHHRILSNDAGNDLAFQQSSDTGANSNFTSYLRIKDGGDIALPVDNTKLLLGASEDLKIWHGETHSGNDEGTNYIESASGKNIIFNVNADGDGVIFHKRTGTGLLNFEVIAGFKAGAECTLRYDGSLKFETDSEGVKINDCAKFNTTSNGYGVMPAAISIDHGTNDKYQHAMFVDNLDATGHMGTIYRRKDTSTNSAYPELFYNSVGVLSGSINQTESAVTYSTSSDYRLKENQVNISDGITRVKQLKPYRFNFKTEPSKTVDGFFAHEAQTVVPEAVSGTKDEVDSKGEAVIQGIDQSKLVPLLTAALQEAITEIETLKTKVAALEAG